MRRLAGRRDALCRELGVKRAHLLKHYHSGDVEPMGKVVGYASVALEV